MYLRLYAIAPGVYDRYGGMGRRLSWQTPRHPPHDCCGVLYTLYDSGEPCVKNSRSALCVPIDPLLLLFLCSLQAICKHILHAELVVVSLALPSPRSCVRRYSRSSVSACHGHDSSLLNTVMTASEKEFIQILRPREYSSYNKSSARSTARRP